jgi:hypothetical protein
MGQGKRLHLSSERMALLVSGAPAFGDSSTTTTIVPTLLKRVQDISYGFDYGAQQLREIGSYEYIKDRTPSTSRIPIIAQPTVGLQFGYLFFDTLNEKNIGFNVGVPDVGGNAPDDKRGIFSASPLYHKPAWNGEAFDMVASKGDVNFFVLAEDSDSRKDIVGRDDPLADLDLIGFGNCYLQNYSLSASLGSFATCTLDYACSNLAFDIVDSDILSPAVGNDGVRSTQKVELNEAALASAFESLPVKYEWSAAKTYKKDDRVVYGDETYEALDGSIGEVPSSSTDFWTSDTNASLALAPGDIEVKLINNKPNQGAAEGFHSIDLNDANASIQSLEINVPIERKDINGFGSNYMKDRKMQFPILATLSLNFIARDYEKKGQISNIFNDDIDYDIVITFYNRTSLSKKLERAVVKVHNAKLNAESHSASIGGFATIDASFLFEVTPVPSQCGLEILQSYEG